MKPALTRIVPWGQERLAEVVQPGDLCVDLTAGKGQDTLALCQLTGAEGQVVAFDIQPEALGQTAELLTQSGVNVRRVGDRGSVLNARPGVDLICDGHENLGRYLPGAPKAVIANLGYLPGGDTSIITLPSSTLAALEQSASCLAPGGRLAIVAYPGHPGGSDEATAVADFFSDLSEQLFQVLLVKAMNRVSAPVLYVAEKR